MLAFQNSLSFLVTLYSGPIEDCFPLYDKWNLLLSIYVSVTPRYKLLRITIDVFWKLSVAFQEWGFVRFFRCEYVWGNGPDKIDEIVSSSIFVKWRLEQVNLGKAYIYLYIYIYMSCACVLSLSLSLNSRRHVEAIISARVEKARFRMRVILGVILIRSLVITKHIPGRLRSDSGVALE